MNIEFTFLSTVNAKSSIKVLSDLLRMSEVVVEKTEAILQRVDETRNGFVAAITISGRPNSGSIYVYDRPTSSLFMLETEDRDSDFSRLEIDLLVATVVDTIAAATADNIEHRHSRGRRQARTGSYASRTDAVATAVA